MKNCDYKEKDGSCVHPGKRNCCEAELIHQPSNECDKNDEMEEFFWVTKEKAKKGPQPEKNFLKK